MNMKKICYLVVGYAPTPQKEEALITLLKKIKESGHPILLVMHNIPSPHVIDMVEYFFYDSNNEVTTYYPVKGDWFYPRIYNSINITPESYIWSQYSSNLKYHGLAAMSMMFQGLMLAKSIGYDICHMLEYDTDVTSFDEFVENEELLQSAASVYYYLGPTESMIYCQIASYNLNEYSLDDFNWGAKREEVKKIVNSPEYGINSGMAEVAFYQLLHTKKSSIKKEDSSLVKNGFNIDLSGKFKLDQNDTISITPFIDGEGNMYVILYYESKITEGRKYGTVVVNTSNVYNMEVESSKEWAMHKIGTLDTVELVDFYMGGVLIKRYDFINEIDKQYFSVHSILRNKSN